MSPDNKWLVTASVNDRTFVIDDEGNKIEWGGVRQIPTFILDGNIQGITGVLHAHKIAQQILNPLGILKVNIYVERAV